MDINIDNLTPEQRAEVIRATGIDKTLARLKAKDIVQEVSSRLAVARDRVTAARAKYEPMANDARVQFDAQIERLGRPLVEAEASLAAIEAEASLAAIEAEHAEAVAALDAATKADLR